MILLVIFSFLLFLVLGFCLGAIYILKTTTKDALDGWKDTLEAWDRATDELKEELEKDQDYIEKLKSCPTSK